jgi:hypothetical protein
LAKRDTAIHAAGTLVPKMFLGWIGIDFFVVFESHDRQTPFDFLALELFETSWLSHAKS